MDRQALRQRQATLRLNTIEEKVEATFGPNPCTSLVLVHEDGTRLEMPCNGKRCIHCGPRKKATIQLQMQQGFGDYAYITTYSDRIELDRAIERIRKADSRANRTPVIQSVGDATLGWILVSNRPTCNTQRPSTLSDWTRRILDRYHHSVQRIRRSYALGRLSLLRRRKSTNSGHPSPWAYADDRDYTKAGINAIQQAEIDRRDSLSDDVGWHVWQEGGKLMNTIQAWQ